MVSASGSSGSVKPVRGIVHGVAWLAALPPPVLSCSSASTTGSIDIPFQSAVRSASPGGGGSGGATSSRVGDGGVTSGLELVRRMSSSRHTALKLSRRTTTRHRALSPPSRRRATISQSSSVYWTTLSTIARCRYRADRLVQNFVYRAWGEVFDLKAACAAGMTFDARARRWSW